MTKSFFEPPNGNFLKLSALIFSFIVTFLALSKFFGLKIGLPKEQFMLQWFPAEEGAIANKKNGKVYGWIVGKGDELRFVKMDMNSENKVRKEREEPELEEKDNNSSNVIYISEKDSDVRSERIFSRDSKYKQFDVNARVKFRLRESKMLYRLAISLPTTAEKTCVNNLEEQTLLNLTKERDNKVRFRFIDADDFWLRDNLLPLSEAKANNFKTSVIDFYNKDECGRVNKLVFHGRLDNFTLPDYSWVEDGKLIFSGVRIIEAQPEEK